MANTTEYGVIVKTIPDTNSFDEELNSKLKGKKREIDINVKVSEEAVKRLNNIDERFKQVKRTVETGFKVQIIDKPLKDLYEKIENTKKKLEDLKKVDLSSLSKKEKDLQIENLKKTEQDLKSLNKELENYSLKFEEAYKVTQTFKDGLGETQTAITYVTEAGKILNSEVVKSTKNIEEAEKAAERLAKKSEQEAEALEKKNQKLKESNILYEEHITKVTDAGNLTIDSKRNEAGQTIRTEVLEYESKYGQLVQKTNQYLIEQDGTEIELGKTHTKVINDHIKKQEEYNKKIEAVEKKAVENYKKEYDAYKNYIEKKEKEAEENWKKYEEEERKRAEAEKKEAEELKKKNEELKKSTILYEENIKAKTNGGNLSVVNKVNAAGQTERTEILEYEDKHGRLVQQTNKFLIEQNGAISQIGETYTKVIDDQIKRQEELNNKIKITYGNTRRYKNAKGNEVVQSEFTDEYGTTTIRTAEKAIDDYGKVTETTRIAVRNLKGELVDARIETKEYTDEIAQEEKAQKKAEEEAKKSAKEHENLVNSLKKLYEQQQKINKAVVTYKENEKKVFDFKDKSLHTIQKETKAVTDLNNETKEITTVTDKWVDLQGMLHTKISKTEGDLTTYTHTIEKMKKGIGGLGQSFSDIIVKVAKFYLASLPIRAVQTAITNAIQSVKDFDSALTEFKKVSDLSGESLDKYTEKLEKLGKLTARTRTEMVQMATEFKRSSFSDEESAQLAQTASLYQNIADEELSASDASAVLISQMKAFRLEADDSIHVIDAINEVANRNAVSSGDIGRGLTQAGAALATYGNTFEETIGLVTAGTEIFQGRSQQVARGLNTVASRVAKNEKALKEYGVEIYDKNNELRSTYDILSDLSKEWETMTNAEKVSLGTTLAGVNQYKVFSAVMTNFKTATKATEEALSSEGSALKENEKYMESIEARIQSVKNEWQELILNSSVSEMIKIVLKLTEGILKLQNAVGGLLPLLVLMGGTLLAINWANIINGFIRFGSTIASGISSLISFNSTLSATEITAEGVTVAIAGVTLAITALIAVFSLINNLEEKSNQKFQELINTTSDYFNTTNKVLESLQNESIKREELNSIIENNFDSYDAEILKLMDVNEAREKAIELLEKERKDRAQALIDEGLGKYEETIKREKEKSTSGWAGKLTTAKLMATLPVGYINANTSDLGLEDLREEILNSRQESERKRLEAYESGNTGVYELYTKEIKMYGDALALLDEQLEKDKTNQKNFEKALELTGQAYNKVTGEIISLGEAIKPENKDNTFVTSLNDDLDALKESFNLTEEQVEKVRNTLYEKIANGDEEADVFSVFAELFPELAEQTDNAVESLDEFKESLNATDEEIKKAQGLLSELNIKENALEKQIKMSSVELVRQAEAWGLSASKLYEYIISMNHFNDSLDNVQENYKTLQSAVDEYNESGVYSIDTVQTLLKMSPDYLSMLYEENGIMKLNKDAIKDKVQALALEAKQNIYNTAIERLKALSTDDGRQAEIEAGKAYDDSTDKINKESDALLRNTEIQYLNTIAKERASGGSVKDTYINQIIEETKQQIELIDKMVDGLGKDFSKSMGGATDSTKDTNNALKEQNNLLKQQKQLLEEKKKQYESVVSYIKKKIQDEIKSIETEKKAQVDAIKDQIEALKDLKEEELDRIQDQIDALKNQKEVEKDFWQEKIDALKEQNDELNTQLEREELLEELAKARSKKVRVYKEGQGFVYTEDTKEVDKAREKLEEFDRKQAYEEQLKTLERYKEQSEKNYEAQIKALEKLKDEKEKNYDQQIKNLEEYQKQVENNYDARIEYFQNYLDKFTEQTDAYENETNRQLAIQLTGIDFEQQGWQTRLDNLANFVEEYNKLLGDIHTLDDGDLDNNIDTNSTVTNTTDEEETIIDEKEENKNNKNKTKTTIVNGHTKGGYTKNISIEGHSVGGNNKKISAKGGKRASGDSYIKEDGMYLVGDSPNQELVIGSKLNGNLMNLTQGSGVVNATSTRTLAGMLNQLGFANQGVNVSNSQSKNTNINIGNISLPSVQNGKDFVDYLQNFSLQMTQEAFA